MKILVSHNSDGHFSAVSLSDREKTRKFLFGYDEDDGSDYVEQIIKEFDPQTKSYWDNYSIISDYTFERLIREFEQRGTMEIIEL